MNRSEYHSTATSVQQLPQMLSVICLHWSLAKNFMAALKLPKELIIQVVSICKNHQGWILHSGVAYYLCSIEQHRKALTASLRMPDHTNSAVSNLALFALFYLDHATCSNSFCHCKVHCMKLMIACDDLLYFPRVWVFIKYNKVLQ